MAEIKFGSAILSYTVIYSNRSTLGITVFPNGNVIIKAPYNASDEKIEEKVHKRAAWIIKQQRYFQSVKNQMPPRRYISGESHFYLGKQYKLLVTETEDCASKNNVSFKGRSFEISCNRKSGAESLMKEWYRQRAKVKFAEIAEPVIQRFKKYHVEPSSIYIQQMENRWGSCTPKGKIILNIELIKMPKPCIEYVITHELCHLLHRNHTTAFYKLLTTEMPDWERWKNRLEQQ